MTKILASIKNVHEAEIISKFNFDIIDIKNVNDGALGYVGDKSIEKIAKIFRNNKLRDKMRWNLLSPQRKLFLEMR